MTMQTTGPLFITARQVAALMGLDNAQAFYRQRDRLETDHAFPLPMPTLRRKMLWRRDCIECWLSEQGRAKGMPVPTRPEGPNVYLMEEARRA